MVRIKPRTGMSLQQSGFELVENLFKKRIM